MAKIRSNAAMFSRNISGTVIFMSLCRKTIMADEFPSSEIIAGHIRKWEIH